MTFIFELKEDIDIEEVLLQKELINYDNSYKFIYCKKEDLENLYDENNKRYWIPVGDIDFVQKALKIFYNIDKINPIEIPKCLRDQEFLKREYKIVGKNELPNDGVYFVKQADKPKGFSYFGNIKNLKDYINEIPDGLYQISSAKNIISEWRVYVHRNKILSVANYDGNSNLYPNSEIIQRMVNIYRFDKNQPDSYTMDVAITEENETILIEIHPFISVGLYSTLFDNKLPLCYFDGIRWCVEKNLPIEQ